MGEPVVVVGANGDLGRALLEALRRVEIPAVAVVRAAVDAATLRASGLSSVVQISEISESWRQLQRVVAGASLVFNCAGMTAKTEYSTSDIRRSFDANVLLAVLLGLLGEEAGVPVVHTSTGMLDSVNAPAPMSSEDLLDMLSSSISPERKLHQLSRRSPDMAPADSLSPYLAHKSAMEFLLAAMPNSRALRLSNFFGPGCRRPRLVPRLIEGRLRGWSSAATEQWRNYSYVDELADFLLALVERSRCLPGPVIWAYGAHDVSYSMLVEHVARVLPSCYGTTSVALPPDNGAPDRIPGVPRFSDYYPELAGKTVGLHEALVRTVAFWRERVRFDEYEFVDSEFRLSRISGGSVATKRLTADAGGVFVKRATVAGYEGAGIAKVAAELRFYRTMPDALRALYPRLVDGDSGPADAELSLVAHGDGSTVADTAVDGLPLPVRVIRELVCDAFTAGYLRRLRIVSDPCAQWNALCSYYLDRAVGRLSSLIELVSGQQLEPDESSLVQLLRTGGSISVDGAVCENPQLLLTRIREQPAKRFLPRSEGPCSHGDMTILNMLWRDNGQLLLVDPRGVSGNWDPAYDLGKLAFSLSGFAHCVKGKLGWFRDGNQGFRVVEHGGTLDGALELRQRIASWLLVDERFARLAEVEPYLHDRIALAEATHYLADAPYRYAQGRDIRRALLTVLLGVKFLQRAYLGQA